MKKQTPSSISRRNYLKKTLIGAAGMIALPTIVPSSVFGKNAPSNKIQIAQIGFGRIAMGHDLPDTMRFDSARVIAVADVDSNRLKQGKQWIEKYYSDHKKPGYVDVRMYDDYRELLLNKEIDAVIISTPDHWHAQPTIEAVYAGKDVYLQKPASLTIDEGRQMSDAVHRTGRIFQIGSQQRSANPWPQFKRACELVRNGRIGQLHTVKVGLGTDPGGPVELEMPIPANLNYDYWLGSTPYIYYTENRVHPQNSLSDRPGWLRCEQFGAGMITGWGAHHIDTAHWGMDTEYTGPIEVEGTATYPKSGLWNAHGDFKVTAKYANGVTMLIGSEFPNGVRFEGSEGWIFVSRGNVGVTASDPSSAKNSDAFNASDAKILTSVIGENEIKLYESADQHGNWLECIQTRKQPIATAEVAHRSCSACLVAHTAMKLQRKLYWDPVIERFKNDDEANSMLSRPQRYPYGTNFLKVAK
jgi:myo-inositol 2-dehydrogenase / D-chiro-inositol 1-dehydrogenase